MAGQYYPHKIDVCKRRSQYPRHINDIRAEQVFEKKTNGLSCIHQEVFVTYIEISQKNSSAVVVTVP